MNFGEIALLLTLAASFAIIARLLKQPLLIGYLFAGAIIAYLNLGFDHQAWEGLAQMGVTLLLFLVGIEMNVKDVLTIGKVALLTGLGQIIFTSFFGFLLASVLGFEVLPALYIAIALTFSSTIIIVKLLTEKNDMDSLYGRISIGFLLVQDFVAILLLMFLTGIGDGGLSPVSYMLFFLKSLLLVILVYGLAKYIFPRLYTFLAHSTELLYVVSIAWALGFSAWVAGPLELNAEVGGFLAGIALSTLPEHLQIASKTRPLRDFFLTIFFLLLGTKLIVSGIGSVILPAIIFSLFVLIGNPFIVLVILGFLGYKNRTSFQSGLTVAQISEFSFVLMALGLGLGHVTSSEVALVVIVGVITMTVSTYMILGSDTLYPKLSKFLAKFERKQTHEKAFNQKIQKLSKHYVLIGADRTGRKILPLFTRKGIPYQVVDFNPEVYTQLTADGIPVILGDIADDDIFDLANLENAKVIISTVGGLYENTYILEKLSKLDKKPVTVFTSKTREDALKLYEYGASVVILPQMVAGDYVRYLIIHGKLSSEKIEKTKKYLHDSVISYL